MTQSNTVRAGLVVIGDEILSGRTQDANIAYLAKWLNEEGVSLAEVRIVGDERSAIIEAVNALRQRCDYCFTTGGIGPTHDDITVDAVAGAFDVGVIYNDEALAMLAGHYGEEGLTEARKRMARVPEGGGLVHNPMSGAPGVRKNNVFMLAGIPGIMRGMLEGLRGELAGAAPMLSGAVTVFAPESEMADRLAAIQNAHPEVSIGSYPFFRRGEIGAALVVRSTNNANIPPVLDAIRHAAEAIDARWVDGEASD
ncbi:MAG: molybdopterin-binding protein [Pseudomonadota bacterium]